jgi:hypothetical protein
VFRGCGITRSHATTNQAFGRQRCIERCYHIEMERGGMTKGNTTISWGKQEAPAHNKKAAPVVQQQQLKQQQLNVSGNFGR